MPIKSFTMASDEDKNIYLVKILREIINNLEPKYQKINQSDLIKNLDCDSPLFHKQDPVIGGLEYCKDWEMKIYGNPGLNIELDNNFLNSCHKIKC